MDIPWAELRGLYNSVAEDIQANKEAMADEMYRDEIAQLERDYTANHEAPYEGNFSDKIPRPSVTVTAAEVEKEASKILRSEFIEKYGLINHIDWFMPQMITLIGNMEIVRDSDGKISGRQFRDKNFNTDALKGIYRFLMLNERSSYLKLQYKLPAKQYCSLVPLIPYAVRLVKGTPYSEWSREDLAYVVNSELCKAMLVDYEDFEKSDLLEQRDLGLTTAGTGVMKNPLTTHMLYGAHLKEGIFKDIPSLARVMLTQIWCAHPSNRTKYMVLDPKNWDKMPPALVDTDVFKAPIKPMESGPIIDDWK